ncbi:MAG: FkbM family methyltransferase [Bacteroidota bacterium]|nr:FkbM family methyltransferase [Bacteroidota bacterium]
MKGGANEQLYKHCKSKGLHFNHVCEVGVYLPETSNILEFTLEGVRTTLVEPDPKSVKAIHQYFRNNKNISLFPYAVFDYNGLIELSKRESSTFVTCLKSSPALVNDSYIKNKRDNFQVECKTFDKIDDGTIDLLSIDTEGCEWYVIKNIRSRPKVISIETHGKSYVNSFINEIKEWVEANDYVIWYKDKSDSVYIRNGLFDLTAAEKLKLKTQIFSLYLARQKYKLKKTLTRMTDFRVNNFLF